MCKSVNLLIVDGIVGKKHIISVTIIFVYIFIYLQQNDDIHLMQKLMDAQDYIPTRKSRDSCIVCHCPLKSDHVPLSLAGTHTGKLSRVIQ